MLRSPFCSAAAAECAAAALTPNSREAFSSPSGLYSLQDDRTAATSSPAGTSHRNIRKATPPAIRPPPSERSSSAAWRTADPPGRVSA